MPGTWLTNQLIRPELAEKDLVFQMFFQQVDKVPNNMRLSMHRLEVGVKA